MGKRNKKSIAMDKQKLLPDPAPVEDDEPFVVDQTMPAYFPEEGTLRQEDLDRINESSSDDGSIYWSADLSFDSSKDSSGVDENKNFVPKLVKKKPSLMKYAEVKPNKKRAKTSAKKSEKKQIPKNTKTLKIATGRVARSQKINSGGGSTTGNPVDPIGSPACIGT